MPHREDLGRFYRPRFEFFKKRLASFNPETLETHMSIVRTGELLRASADQRMRGHGLTGPAFGILCLLESSPGKSLTMHEIGEQLLVTPANVTGLIDTLERRGLVRRHSETSDRRVRTIRITPKGSRKLDEIHPEQHRFTQSLYADLSAKQKKTVIDALRLVRRALIRMSVGLLLVWAAAPARAEQASSGTVLTLEDCYRLALNRSETLAIRAERLLQMEQLYRQAFGAILPDIDFNYTETYQDTDGVDSSAGGVGGTLTRSERPEAKISAHQPLFAGLREWSASKSVRADSRRDALLMERAKKLLFQQTAAAFYLVVQNETDLRNVQTSLRLTEDRVKELKGRIQLGKSRSTEIFSVESQLAALRAQQEQVQADLDLARENLSFLTGVEVSSGSIADRMGEIAEVQPVDAFLARSPARTDVKAAMETVESSRMKVRAARGAFLPVVALDGNYYLKRVGFQEPIDWDVVLSLKQPLFRGGALWTENRRMESVLREARKDLERVQREAESEIRRNYLTLRSALSQTRSLEESYRKAEASYQSMVKEYRLGLVNNLEVLQATNQMQDAKRSWDRAAVKSKLAYLQLKVSTEDMP
jgi:outer membrane protein TolC